MQRATDLNDVVIIGCGPVGATLALLLGRRRLSIAIADMHRDVYDKPRAINLDQEALRTLQATGLVDEIVKGCEPHPGTDFLGVDGELIKYIYSAKPPYPLGWPANLMFVQPKAEKILRQELARLPNIELLLGCEAIGLDQMPDHVEVTFRHTSGETFTARAHYAVGCDGANSPVRNWLGIGQEDLGFSEWWLVVDAWLKRHTPLPPRSTQYCYPDAPTSYIVCSGNLRRWELKILPHEDPQSYESPDRIRARMACFVDTDALEFWRSSVYHFHARVADNWQKGRVLLAGDAAHQMPPFLGQGLCAGFRDAVNLAWKLAMVIDGTAARGLLATYTQERKPHIRELTAITVELGKIIGETDPACAATRDRRLREDLTSGRVETVRQNLIPPLQHGLIDRDATDGKSMAAGTLAVQPLIEQASGTVLLDELTGPSFVILTRTPLPRDCLDPELATEWRRRGGLIVTIGDVDTGGEGEPQPLRVREQGHLFSDWMRFLDAEAVVVRPDRQVYGAAKTPGDLNRLLRTLIAGLDAKA
jgi:3-(3-hydroxy-phenyl)propionate hydroxylase